MSERLVFFKGFQSAFLNEFLRLEKKTVGDFCSASKTPQSTFKNWLYEKRLLPQDFFDSCVKRHASLKAWESKILEKRPSSWGRVKGGTSAGLALFRNNPGELARRQSKGGRASIALRFQEISEDLPSLDNPELYEFLGALYGDGWLGVYGGRKQISLCGNLKERQYARHLECLFKRLFKRNLSYSERKEYGAFYLSCKNSIIFAFIVENFDFPVGRKGSFSVSRLPKETSKKIAFLRGFFDTDGGVYFDKNKNYASPYPIICITSINQNFLDWLEVVLKRMRFKVIRAKNSVRLKGRENVARWFNEIRPANKRKLEKYAQVGP